MWPFTANNLWPVICSSGHTLICYFCVPKKNSRPSRLKQQVRCDEKAPRRLQNLNKGPLLINLLAMRTTYETTKSLYCLRTFIIAECHAACEKHQGNFREANWKFSNRVYIWRPYIFWSFGLLSAQNWTQQNLAYSVFQRFFKEFTSANVAWSAITTKNWLADSRKDISKMIG